MATFNEFENIVMSFPEVKVEPHFEKISFRINKKIFATYGEGHNMITLKLTQTEQDFFSSLSSQIYQVDNKWGKQGWTFVKLDEIPLEILTEVLKSAYCGVAPKNFSEQIKMIKK